MSSNSLISKGECDKFKYLEELIEEYTRYGRTYQFRTKCIQPIFLQFKKILFLETFFTFNKIRQKNNTPATVVLRKNISKIFQKYLH